MALSKPILVVTACGRKKHSEPKRALELYRSPRVKAVHNRRSGHDMKILSAEYGLVDAGVVIEPYEAVMTKQRIKELIPQVVEQIKDYDAIVYFRAGARKEYYDCIRDACEVAGKTLVSLGYGMMGDINELPRVIRLVEQGQLKAISHIKSAQVDRF